MMLVDAETIQAEAEKLEIRYLANKEDNLLFGLFSDYTDAAQAHCEADESLLQAATECIEALNQRYGGERFFLFHRERKWSESEQKFIGWERKRGKLEELNRLIDGTRPDDADRLVYVGDPDHLSNVRFVITLDSDTQLPHGTARRMIETLAHPLNQPRFDAEGRILAGSYTIIQPRVSPSLPSTSGSPFSRLFSDPVGIDPYTNAVSDVNQDLTGEGSYHGKGIYDVRAFSRVLSGRFPEAWLLSHDLIEGAHVRVGLASDIELYDEFPQDYLSYTRRQHRWIRGDWQIADWILPRVPQPGGRTRAKPALLVRPLEDLRQLAPQPAARGQPGLADGLLADLLPGRVDRHRCGRHATALPLLGAALHLGDHPSGAEGLLLLESGARSAAGDCRSRTASVPGLAGSGCHCCGSGIAAIISHRRLLEWTSAQVTHGNAQAKVPMFLLSMGLASLFSVIVGWAVHRWRPANLAMASPWLMLLVPLPADRLAPEPATAGEAAAIPASGRGSAVPEECRTTNLALFLGLCRRRDLLAAARQLPGLPSESTGHADQSDQYRSLDGQRARRP